MTAPADLHRITGRAWIFGDSIDTDAMYPGFAMKLDTAEAARHVFYDLRPGWTEQVRRGDVVVAGRNFGVGSSRPVATLLKHLGVSALVAEEFNSLFLRNAINNGLPAITVPDVRNHINEATNLPCTCPRVGSAAATSASSSPRCPAWSSTSSTRAG